MKYCAQCGTEYLESVSACSDCESTEFRTTPLPQPLAETAEASGRAASHDIGPFQLVVTTEDPLTADQYEAVLLREHIPVNVREQQSGTVDLITDGVLPFWEIYVPAEMVGRASDLIRHERLEIELHAEEAARAAEEEAAQAQQSRP